MNIFPWERNEKPYFIDGDFKWYIDKMLNDHAEKIDAMCFIVAKNNEPSTRVLIDKKTNNILYEHKNFESMACHIDMLYLALHK